MGFFMARFVSTAAAVLFTFFSLTNASAQGVQTGAVRGVVKDTTGQVVPQAAIHAESPAHQGARLAVSDHAGAYQLAGLAPGDYTVRFEFDGFQTVTSTVRVSLGSIE